MTAFKDNGKTLAPDTTGDKMLFVFGWLLIVLVFLIALIVFAIKVFWKKAIVAPFNWASEPHKMSE